jgi:hypothetical protein
MLFARIRHLSQWEMGWAAGQNRGIAEEAKKPERQ